MRHAIAAALFFACAAGSTARAQDVVVQPADGARQRAEATAETESGTETETETESGTVSESGTEPGTVTESGTVTGTGTETESGTVSEPVSEPSVASYEARATVPAGQGALHEEERIGSYAQPRWTARRRFPTTRVYVRPEGTFAVEWWLQSKQSLKDPQDARYRSQYELEMGLGHRLQVDVYLETEQDGHQAPLELRAEKLELRWALADWGVLLLNPTLYAELVRMHEGPPKVELKALLGEELAPRWHFGFNLVFERELGGAMENEYAAVTGLSYSVADDAFALGAEVKAETTDVAGDRFAFDAWELLAGPSLSWRPVPPMHLLFVTLFGQETAGPERTGIVESTLVLGWEL